MSDLKKGRGGEEGDEPCKKPKQGALCRPDRGHSKCKGAELDTFLELKVDWYNWSTKSKSL